MKNKTIFIPMLAATLLSSPMQAQNNKIPVEDLKRKHEEKLDDPYKPNAYNNTRTSPAYRFSNRFKSGSQQSSITTSQVNVNALGENIIGDAANEPSIAVNAWHPENMVIGWRQFDDVTSNFRQAGWGFTTDSGHSWTFPGVIDPGVFRSDPVLDYDANGNIYYNSLTNSPGFFCKVFATNNGGASWDSGTDAHGGDKQWMVIDRTPQTGSGNIYAFWSYFYSTCDPGFATRSADGNDSYEDCFPIDGSPYWGTMAVGNSGELYVGGASGVTDSLVVAKSLNARDAGSTVTWNPPVKVFIGGNPNVFNGVNPGGLLGQVSIDVDRSNGPGRGNVYMLVSATRSLPADPCDVMFVRSTNGGLTWEAPMRVNDDVSTINSQWFGTMSVSPTGRIDAIWLDTRDAPAGTDSSALYYSFSSDQGKTWSANEKMSLTFNPHVGYPDQNKMGDYFDMLSDSTGAHLAWANTINGEQDVYYSHIVPYTSTGIDEPLNTFRISTFPNPVTGTLTISGLAMGSHIDVYTVLGAKVVSVNNSAATSMIDMTQFPAGIYLLKVVDPSGNAVVKKIVRD